MALRLCFSTLQKKGKKIQKGWKWDHLKKICSSFNGKRTGSSIRSISAVKENNTRRLWVTMTGWSEMFFLRTRYGAASSFALKLSGKAWQNGLVDDAPRAGDAGWLWGTKRVGHENIKLWDGAHLYQLKLQDIRMFFSTLTLPWTLSRMCCWLSPAALVARQVYFPESSSFAFVTFSILPADSSCGKQKRDEKDGTDTFSWIYAVYTTA